MAIFYFRQKNSTVILSMSGVKAKKETKITFLVYNKGIFFRKVDKQLHSSFNCHMKQGSLSQTRVEIPFMTIPIFCICMHNSMLKTDVKVWDALYKLTSSHEESILSLNSLFMSAMLRLSRNMEDKALEHLKQAKGELI